MNHVESALYFGDNLEILRTHIKDQTIDLIYLDPPFNSKANYNIIFKTPKEENSPSQIQAFEDTWKWNSTTEFELYQLFGAEPKLAELMKGLEMIIGKNDLLAYLVMMAIRLRELHRVLKDTGSLYLHCDPTASHYLKLILDSIFGPENFQNEIIWQRTGAHNDPKKFGKIHDVLLFYSKTKSFTFNPVFIELSKEHLRIRFNQIDKKTGKRFFAGPITAPGSGPSRIFLGKPLNPPNGRHWSYTQEKIDELQAQNLIYYSKTGTPYLKQFMDDYAKQGRRVQSIWIDILPSKTGKERMGYPTQKPIALLERIINASSNEGDTILDPFCGCGTAVVVAQKLKRNWIGIDITHLAIGLMEKRIYGEFGIKPKVIGNPVSFVSAENLFKRNPLDFERWAVTRIKGIHPNKKQVGDKGVDGKGYIGSQNQYKTIVSVKGGKRLTPSMVYELIGVVEKEKASFGVLITIHNPTKGMKQEAAKAGITSTPLGQDHPKIQIYTITDYFDGKKPDLPL